jgi:putative hydrolase of the HAD superfamily
VRRSVERYGYRFVTTRAIKAVLFDLDGTLYDRDRLAADLFAEQYASFAQELACISRERFLRDVLAMDAHGHGSKETGYPQLAKSWGADSALAARLYAHFRETYDRHCHLSDDTRATLDALRARGLELGVITNGGSEMQRRKLVGLGLDRSFDVVLVSEEEGVRKPDAEIFRRALARLEVDAREAIFVGDHPVADVEGAHRAGLLAVWKFVPYWPPVVPTAPTIRALAEVLQLL